MSGFPSPLSDSLSSGRLSGVSHSCYSSHEAFPRIDPKPRNQPKLVNVAALESSHATVREACELFRTCFDWSSRDTSSRLHPSMFSSRRASFKQVTVRLELRYGHPQGMRRKGSSIRRPEPESIFVQARG